MSELINRGTSRINRAAASIRNSMSQDLKLRRSRDKRDQVRGEVELRTELRREIKRYYKPSEISEANC